MLQISSRQQCKTSDRKTGKCDAEIPLAPSPKNRRNTGRESLTAYATDKGRDRLDKSRSTIAPDTCHCHQDVASAKMEEKRLAKYDRESH